MYQQIVRQIARAAHFPISRYGHDHFVLTADIVSELRAMSYINQWSASRQNEWFHIEMEDLSIFSFTEGATSSYSYLQCPLDVPSYRSYLNQQGLEYSTQNRREQLENYQMLLETAGVKPHLTPIRYDLDPHGYRTGVHPLAHIHIGMDNSVRIGLRKKMTPLAFVLFVMRQAYPESWARLLQHREVENVEKKIRTECDDVDDDRWREHDRLELHLA